MCEQQWQLFLILQLLIVQYIKVVSFYIAFTTAFIALLKHAGISYITYYGVLHAVHSPPALLVWFLPFPFVFRLPLFWNYPNVVSLHVVIVFAPLPPLIFYLFSANVLFPTQFFFHLLFSLPTKEYTQNIDFPKGLSNQYGL